MKTIRNFIRICLDRFGDLCAKNKYFNFLLEGYYALAVQSLAGLLKKQKFDQILNVYVRHRDWILGVSDIDLVFIIKPLTPDQDIAFFKKLWKSYIPLRILFPVLCDIDEIRFINAEQIDRHPLRMNKEASLLLAPQKWACIYSKDASRDPVAFPITDKTDSSVPHTRFLYFNLYSYWQWVILSGGRISELRFFRLRKCTMKILQHLFYLNEKTCFDIKELTQRLSGGEGAQGSAEVLKAKEIFRHLEEVPRNSSDRRSSMTCAFRKLILYVQQVHCKHYDLNTDLRSASHSQDKTWLGQTLGDFIDRGEELFGDQFQVVALRPIYEIKLRAFLLIDEKITQKQFDELLRFVSRYHQKLFQSKVQLFVATDKILTSQFYALWSPHALEAYLLLARDSFNPRGLLKIKVPPENWTLWKIRNSVSIFGEYYLPLLTSPRAKGDGGDFCKIYERTDIEMLFHYFYYLKDREAYLRDLAATKGDSNEILCITASKYANEIGMADWHPDKYADAYPYIKRMISLVDQMAYVKSQPQD